MQQAEKCPVCKADWPHNKFVGERAITTSEQYLQGKRRSGNTQREGAAAATSVPNPEENNEEQDEENAAD